MSKMGRKPIELDWQKVDLYCSYKMTQEDVAYLARCSVDTLERAIAKKYQCTFAEYRLKKLSETRARLITKALTKAEAGDNTMIIFCLKNLCKWSDNPSAGFRDIDE